MPKFLEKQLKKEYGEDSDVPYKVMNKLGYMKGNKETAKGRAAEKKHSDDSKDMKQPVRHQGRLDDKTKGQMLDKLTKKGKK